MCSDANMWLHCVCILSNESDLWNAVLRCFLLRRDAALWSGRWRRKVSSPSSGMKYVLLGLCFITQKTLCKFSPLWQCYVSVRRVIVRSPSKYVIGRRKFADVSSSVFVSVRSFLFEPRWLHRVDRDSIRGVGCSFRFYVQTGSEVSQNPGQRSPAYISLKLKWLERDFKLRMPSIRVAIPEWPSKHSRSAVLKQKSFFFNFAFW
jgi:hypothetical protein